jgi:hypothetical protein
MSSTDAAPIRRLDIGYGAAALVIIVGVSRVIYGAIHQLLRLLVMPAKAGIQMF